MTVFPAAFVGREFFPYLIGILHAEVDLTFRLIRQQVIDKPLIQGQLSAVVRDFEHIIGSRISGFQFSMAIISAWSAIEETIISPSPIKQK